MLRFLKKSLWLLPIPLVVAGVNAWVDPAHILGPYEEERQVAQLLLQGQDVSMTANLDERMVQAYYIEGLRQGKETVVFGSSRSMQIGFETFGGSFFNNSLPGPSIEDFLGLYNLYHRRNLLPKKIILCLDPWLLNAHNRQTRWKSLRGEVASALERTPAGGRLGLERFPLDRYYELITLSYFQSSVQALFEKRSSLGENGEMPDQPLKRRDGRWIYPERIQRATLEEVRRATEEYIQRKPIYSLGGFRGISPKLASRFQQLVDLMLRDGVEIVFFLPPYHPLLYDYLERSEEYRIVADVESYFHSVAAQRDIRTVGSYDPGQVGLTEADFYDGLHPKPGTVQRLFRSARR